MKIIRKYLIILLAAGVFMIFLNAAGNTSGRVVYRAELSKDGVQRINLVAGSYFYKPDYIIVRVGVPVELHIKKEPGMIPHNIIMNAPDAGVVFNEDLSGEPGVIKFTPKKTGKYPFYCDKKLLFFKSHKEKGMEGIIEVTD